MRIEILVGGISIILDVVLPEGWRKKKIEGAHCMWLLHDKFSSSSDWISFTQAELFVEEHEIALVCPSANSARYTDWLKGYTWQSYITEKLWDYLHEMFPFLSRNPRDNMLFGFKRGGFGAVKFALANPDRFGAAYSVSYDDGFIIEYISNGTGKYTKCCYGTVEEAVTSQDNLMWFAEKHAESGVKKPKIYLACGTAEKVYKRNVEVRDKLMSLGFDVTWDETPCNGEWHFCNIQLKKALSLLENSC